MKTQVIFKSHSGQKGDEFSFLYETKQGFLYKCHIDFFNEKHNQFLKLLQPHIISFIGGDFDLYEVTAKGAQIITRFYSVNDLTLDLLLVEIIDRGKNRMIFTTEKELSKFTLTE